MSSSGLTTANSLAVTTTSTFTGQATFNGTNIPINIGIASTNSSGSSLSMGLRFSSGGRTNILFNGANASSFNNNVILANDSGIAYNPNNSGTTAGYCIVPQLSSSGSGGSRWATNGDLTQTGNFNVSGATSLSSTTTTTLTSSGSATLNSLTVNGTSTLNSNTVVNTTSGTTSVGMMINNSNPAGSGSSTQSLQLTQGNFGMQLSGILTQGVGASFNLSVGEKTTPSWNTIMSGDQNTLTVASNTTVAKQLNLSGTLNLTNATTYESIRFLNYTNTSYSCLFLSGCSSSGNGNNISITGDNGIVWQTNNTYGFFIAPNQTGPSGTRWDSNGNVKNESLCTMNNNIRYGTNSTILTTATTLSFPLNRVIFVNALVTPFTLTLPTLTSANNGLVVTIRALPTSTQTVTVAFSSSQVMYLSNSASSVTTYLMNGTSGPLHLTTINNYWMQI